MTATPLPPLRRSALRLRGGGDAYNSPPAMASPTYSPTPTTPSSSPPSSPAQSAWNPPPESSSPAASPAANPSSSSSPSPARSGSPPTVDQASDPVSEEQAHLLRNAFAEAVADQAYILVIQMGFHTVTHDQLVALVLWHMLVVPQPWEPPEFYVSTIIDHVLLRVVE